MPKVKLRALEPEDIDLIYNWENDTTIWESSFTHIPFSKHALTQYLMDSLNSDIFSMKQLRLIIEDTVNQAVGCIDIFNFDIFNHRAEIGILIDSKFRGKGFATSAINECCKFTKQHLQLHQISADVALSNTTSIKAFSANGFTQNGTKKDWLFVNGKFEDVIFLQRIL